MRNAADRNESFVVSLLVAIIDAGTRKDTVAVMLVRADVRHAYIRREKRAASVGRTREVHVGLVAEAGLVIPRIVKGQRHIARYRIDRKPMVKAVNRQRVCHGPGFGPRRALIVRKRAENIRRASSDRV